MIPTTLPSFSSQRSSSIAPTINASAAAFSDATPPASEMICAVNTEIVDVTVTLRKREPPSTAYSTNGSVAT